MLLLLLKLWFSVLLLGAQTTASLTVQVRLPDGTPATGAQVRISNPVSGFERDLAPNGRGQWTLEGIPLQEYQLTVVQAGFAVASREVRLRSNVPVTVEVLLEIAALRQSLEVSSNAQLELVDTVATGTRMSLALHSLEALPAPPGRRGIETYLATLPGFAQNANGAIHPRGAHNQMTFVIDGLPIHDQLTGAFATALEPSIVDSLELYTGDVPAEFGSKVSGVAALTTRSGLGAGRPLFGSVETGAASFNTLQTVVQAGGERGKLAYFGTISAVKTSRFLDAVTFENLHNAGDAERAFLRLDYTASGRDALHLNAMAGRSQFQLANLPSQHAAGMQQRQLMRDASVWLRWNRVLSVRSTWESLVAYRPVIAQLFPSPQDTPVTAAQARHLNTFVWANRYNAVLGRHNVRAGADLERFPVSEAFSMAITDGAFNVPGSAKFNDALLAHDLTRGGTPFVFSRRGAGTLVSAFVQDVIRLGAVTISAGLRQDEYRFLVSGRQLQPRVGVAWHLRRTRTVLRASYNRNYQTPPNENLLLSSSPEAGLLAPSSVRAALGQTYVPIAPQRENVFEAGVQQAILGRVTLNASVYHKNSRDQQDNNNFFNTGIIFPVALARIRVNGAEARLTLPKMRGLTASMSATHARAISTPPFTGGLFIGQDAVDQLSSGPFVIDHDQKLSINANAHYAPRRNWWLSTAVRYDSGLVANPSDPAQVAQDPDYRALLPYVNLTSRPARVRPRTITDLGAGYVRWYGDRKLWEAEVHVANVLDVAALYNFQSVFVGTRAVAPRSFAVKLRWWF